MQIIQVGVASLYVLERRLRSQIGNDVFAGHSCAIVSLRTTMVTRFYSCTNNLKCIVRSAVIFTPPLTSHLSGSRKLLRLNALPAEGNQLYRSRKVTNISA